MISNPWNGSNQLGGKEFSTSFKIQKLKGKGKDAKDAAAIVKANELIEIANKQDNLGSMFAACGIQTYGTDRASFFAVSNLFTDLEMQGYLKNEVARTLEGALFGYPDEEFIPGGWSTIAVVLLSPPVGGLIYAVEKSRPTLQKWTSSDLTTIDALDSLGKLNPAAADLVANAILSQQAGFAEEYITPMQKSFFNGFWRGAAMAVKVIVEGAVAAVKEVVTTLPWWITAAAGIGIIIVLHNKFGKK